MGAVGRHPRLHRLGRTRPQVLAEKQAGTTPAQLAQPSKPSGRAQPRPLLTASRRLRGPTLGFLPAELPLKLGGLSSPPPGSFGAGDLLDPLLGHMIWGAAGLGVHSPAQRGPAPEAAEDPRCSQGMLVPAQFLCQTWPSSQVFLCLPRDSRLGTHSQRGPGRRLFSLPGSPEPPGAWRAVLGPTLWDALGGGGDVAPQPGAPETAGPWHLAPWGSSEGFCP